jgi:hypothetical protein
MRIWADLSARVGGPMSFRLVLQPLMAAAFAIKAGLKDGRTGRPPYFWALFHDRAHREALMQEGWRAIGNVFVLGIAMDLIYQVMVLRWFYPGEALIVAFLLACVPYLLLRGTVARLVAARRRLGVR